VCLEIWKTYKSKGKILNNNTEVNTILFADDQILLAEKEEYLQWAITNLNEIMSTYNEISCNKTKSMVMVR
jgi:hypothetical protein